jgi:3-methyladenine DNA glycosylase AlkC
MKFFDVTKWERKSVTTKGTRDKYVLIESSTGDEYFVKYPLKRLGRDYSSETWSEILAYEIGSYLGFNVLEYDFAMDKDKAGCISKSMITNEEEELIEGVSILTAYDNTYAPEDKNTYDKYTFSFVKEAFKKDADLNKLFVDFLKILVFDAIIGNSDRHQSNWGFIKKIRLPKKNKFSKIFKYKKPKIKIKSAPIYDSGCCFGREFNENKIRNILDDDIQFESYLRKGRAELRIDENKNNKISHYDLLKYICEQNVTDGNIIKEEIRKVIKKYDRTVIEDIVRNIDISLDENIRTRYGLSKIRKDFIIKVIDARINKLKEVLT